MNQADTAETVEKVQQTLECTLPTSLLDLYQSPGISFTSDARIAMRLMTFDEVIEFHKIVQEYGWANRGVRVFWTDDNSNYTGLYVTGPLEGTLCFIDHEDIDLSPVYASIRSLVATMAGALLQELGWSELPRDYPATQPSTDLAAASWNWKTVQSLRSLYETNVEEDRIYYAFCMMALTPYEEADSLLSFTYDADMYIQERACDVLGRRRYEPAIDRLAEVARHGMHNGQIVAIMALGKIGSPAARSHLHDLLLTLPQGYGIYIKGALRASD